MTFSKLKNNRLRISLSRLEAEKFFGNAEVIDKNDPKTTLAIKTLFKRAVRENNFLPNTDSVWIEILKNLSGGYDIYFSNSKPTSNILPDALIVVEFASLEDAIAASKAICFTYGKKHPSRLYKYFNRYRMIVYFKSGAKDIPVATEFAERFFTSFTETAKTTEHGKVVISERALEILATL